MAFTGWHVRSLMQRGFVIELEKLANVIPKTKDIPDISLRKFINTELFLKKCFLKKRCFLVERDVAQVCKMNPYEN